MNIPELTREYIKSKRKTYKDYDSGELVMVHPDLDKSEHPNLTDEMCSEETKSRIFTYEGYGSLRGVYYTWEDWMLIPADEEARLIASVRNGGAL